MWVVTVQDWVTSGLSMPLIGEPINITMRIFWLRFWRCRKAKCAILRETTISAVPLAWTSCNLTNNLRSSRVIVDKTSTCLKRTVGLERGAKKLTQPSKANRHRFRDWHGACIAWPNWRPLAGTEDGLAQDRLKFIFHEKLQKLMNYHYASTPSYQC